jgi:DNA-binding response OmpR family regulator
LRILVVEDSVDLANEIAEVLQEMSHEVAIHGGDSLDEVLARVVDGAIELVVLDLVLPGFEGSTLIDALALATDAPAIIVATGFGEATTAPLRPKVDGVLRKPFTVDELGAAVNHVAERRAHPKSGVRPTTGPTPRRNTRGGS